MEPIIETSQLLFYLLVLVIANVFIICIHRFIDKKVRKSLVPYRNHAGYSVEHSPLMQRRNKQIKSTIFATFGIAGYLVFVAILMIWLEGDFQGNELKGMLAFGIFGAGIGTGIGLFMLVLTSLTDGHSHLLNEIVDESRLAVIMMSKQLHVPQVYDLQIKDENLVKKLIETNPIIDELCRLNSLREGIEGKADTASRKQTLSELEALIDLKNVELMPYVDIVFASVGAVNPLDEAESDFNKVAKEIALLKSKAQLS